MFHTKPLFLRQVQSRWKTHTCIEVGKYTVESAKLELFWGGGGGGGGKKKNPRGYPTLSMKLDHRGIYTHVFKVIYGLCSLELGGKCSTTIRRRGNPI